MHAIWPPNSHESNVTHWDRENCVMTSLLHNLLAFKKLKKNQKHDKHDNSGIQTKTFVSTTENVLAGTIRGRAGQNVTYTQNC